MEACEASGVREHGHDSKQEHQVGGPIMQEKVQLVEHTGKKVTKGR
jgi:hypothetical protein